MSAPVGAAELPTAVVVGGHRAGIAVIRSLGRHHIPVVAVVVDRREAGSQSRYVQQLVVAPHPEDARDEFLRVLREVGESVRGAVLFPTTDESLSTVSQHKDELSAHFRVACLGWPRIATLIDKVHTYDAARRLGIPMPRTLAPGSIDELASLEGEITYPCLVKPRVGHRYSQAFGRKMTEVTNRAELMAAVEAAATAGLSVLIQELVVGPDTGGANYNCYRADGAVVAEATARKVRLSPPRFGFPRVVVSAAVPEIEEHARALLAELGIEGFSCTEFKRDARDGQYKLMEVNARPNMSGALSVASGVDFPYLMYRHLALGELPKERPAMAVGRYWIDELPDLKRVSEARRDGRAFVRPYFASRVFALFDRRDPGPFVHTCIRGVAAAIRSVVARVPGPSRRRRSSSSVSADRTGHG